MALDKLLMAAAGHTWRRRSWWVLGLLASSGGLLLNVSVGGISRVITAGLSSSQQLNLEQALVNITSPGTLVAGVTSVFVAGLAFWLFSVVAEGALIVVVNGAVTNQSVGLINATKAGLRLLGRYVGIDTLLFLPLFLLAIAQMILAIASLAGLVLVAMRPGAQLNDLLLVVGFAILISAPILILMLFTGAFVIVMRSLAFRAASIEGMSATDSIRRAWKVMRRHLFSVATLALVLWAIRSLVGTPLRMIAVSATAVGWWVAWANAGIDSTGFNVLLALVGMILALVTWLANGILNVYSSTSWTISYEQWAGASITHIETEGV